MKTMMRILTAISLLAAGAVHAACPAGMTCLSWVGDGNYTDGKAIPTNYVVTYTVMYGAKGGPYTALGGYNGGPKAALAVTVPTPPKPKLCFVVTATALTPQVDKDGKPLPEKPATSALSGEACDTVSLPAPTDGSIEAPTDGSIEK